MNPADLIALKNLIVPDVEVVFHVVMIIPAYIIQGDEEPAYPTGSVLNPGSIGGLQQKEQAKPHAKVEAKIYGKTIQSTADKALDPSKAAFETEKKTSEQIEKKRKQDTAIWDEKEVASVDYKAKSEGRKEPEYDLLYKQSVGTEDIYLGLSGKDPSSVHCDAFSLKVKLPGAKLKEISVDLKEQAVIIQSPSYYLYHVMQYPLVKDKAKAKWDPDKFVLEMTVYNLFIVAANYNNDSFPW